MKAYKVTITNIFILSIISAITIYFSEYYSLTQCVNIKKLEGLNNLKSYNGNGVNFNFCKQISEEVAVDAFNAAKNNYINNSNPKIGLCKYLYSNNNLLYNFHKQSPYSHPSFFLGTYNGLYVNLQLSHSSVNGAFNIFSKKDVIGREFSQYINPNINIYSRELHKIFYNLDMLKNNEVLQSFYNYEEFKINHKNSIESQNYLFEFEKSIKNNFLNVFSNKL